MDTEPKLFHLQRENDVTGLSGTGRVAEGVQFSDGKCILKWNSDLSSIVIHESIDNVKKLHSHDGKTKIIFDESVSESLYEALRDITKEDIKCLRKLKSKDNSFCPSCKTHMMPVNWSSTEIFFKCIKCNITFEPIFKLKKMKNHDTLNIINCFT